MNPTASSEAEATVLDDVLDDDATLDALSRNCLADPAHTNVRAMMGLVDMVFGFGPQKIPHTLGFSKLLQRVETYVTNFSCPESHPWEFGMTRIYLAMVLGFSVGLGCEWPEGGLMDVKTKATALLRETQKALKDRKGGVGVSFPPQALAEVLGAIERTEASIAMGSDHPWFW
jgi:hypothetical protein